VGARSPPHYESRNAGINVAFTNVAFTPELLVLRELVREILRLAPAKQDSNPNPLP
jgi:hypothetical protein